jgi:hypothetical protein
MEDAISEIQNPPSKNNISIFSIIQLLIMLYIGCDAGKEIYDLLKVGSLSWVDLLKIIIDGLVFIGMLLTAYGIFKDNDYLKKGFNLFLYGCLGLLIILVLDLIKNGFSFGSLCELLIICFISYIIYIQIPRI